MTWYLKTDSPIALNNPDTIQPLGAMRDNTVNHKFNWKLYDLFPNKKIAVLDLGCAGGGFVKSILFEGHVAVGLEGCDYNKVNKKMEWTDIPDNLFTCDVARPFLLNQGGDKPYKFNAVTAWEFFEHLDERELDICMENIRQHLKPGGLLICSISNFSSSYGSVQYHKTVQDEAWWNEFFTVRHNFKRRSDLEKYFNGDYVRHVRINMVLEGP